MYFIIDYRGLDYIICNLKKVMFKFSKKYEEFM